MESFENEGIHEGTPWNPQLSWLGGRRQATLTASRLSARRSESAPPGRSGRVSNYRNRESRAFE